RAFVEGRLPWSHLDRLAAAPSDWWQRARKFLLY
ncbi:MAG: hypothetical protein RL398_1962, partial [Planctomycetota bacterium]